MRIEVTRSSGCACKLQENKLANLLKLLSSQSVKWARKEINARVLADVTGCLT